MADSNESGAPMGCHQGGPSNEQKGTLRTQETAPSISSRRTNTLAGAAPSLTDSRIPPFNLHKSTTAMLIPKKPGVLRSIWAIITHSWLNVLLVFIPVSWAVNFALPEQHTIIFICSFLAMIPLAKLMAFATEELSMRVGQTLAGLLNATLGNAVELIVAIVALVKGELRIVQASLIGSILNNLLRMCFFAGALRFSEQGSGISATQLNPSLLAVLLPAAAAFYFFVTDITTSQEGFDILVLSYGVQVAAIILLFIYGCYLAFKLFSHKSLYEDTNDDALKMVNYAPQLSRKEKKDTKAKKAAGESGTWVEKPDVELNNAEVKEEKEETPKRSSTMTITLLVIVTAFVATTADFLVGSIDSLTNTEKIGKAFVGIIFLPIIGNAAEHAAAVTVSVKDKLHSLGVAVRNLIVYARDGDRGDESFVMATKVSGGQNSAQPAESQSAPAFQIQILRRPHPMRMPRPNPDPVHEIINSFHRLDRNLEMNRIDLSDNGQQNYLLSLRSYCLQSRMVVFMVIVSTIGITVGIGFAVYAHI